ncbi:MAG: tetratricopeptide repeat protein [Candidatus Eisenbacteria bacterium]|nr:tetratricopeptide repeat protein [Candidatus Eisenbacteria bacterium]
MTTAYRCNSEVLFPEARGRRAWPGSSCMRFLLVLGLTSSQFACAGARSTGEQLLADGSTREAIPTLEAELSTTFHTGIAVQLGRAYVEAGETRKAEDVFDRVLVLEPKNAEALFRRGVLHEQQGEITEAIGLYSRFTQVTRFSSFRREMEQRLTLLQRGEAERWAAKAAEFEKQNSSQGLSLSTVAVYAFDDTQAPTLSGIGAALAADLNQDCLLLSDLRVVERIRIDAILRELELQAAGYLEPATAPRVSRLVGAGSYLFGTVTELGTGTVRVELRWVETESARVYSSRMEGRPDQFWEIQKLALRDVLLQRDRVLTPQEWARISGRGTRNLDAFLAYGQGLENERRAEYADARAAYRKAAEEDKALIDAAWGELRSSESMSSADELVDRYEEYLEDAPEAENPGPRDNSNGEPSEDFPPDLPSLDPYADDSTNPLDDLDADDLVNEVLDGGDIEWKPDPTPAGGIPGPPGAPGR